MESSLSPEELEVELDDGTKLLNISECAKTKIALVGETGSGKSSFVNALLRGTSSDLPKTGIGSTTSIKKCYPHPMDTNVKLWDLPGLNTLKNTLKNSNLGDYFKDSKLDSYHAFLFFIKRDLKKNDHDLITQLALLKKSLFFVRTNIDRIRLGDKEKEKLGEIRASILQKLQDVSGCGMSVYLVSNTAPEKWDFEKLKLDILKIRETSDDNAEFRVALVGEVGSGRITFLEAMEMSDCKEPRKSGAFSSEPECYVHPDKSNIKFVDLPELDTLIDSDAASYCEEHDLQQYDGYLLLIKRKFTKIYQDLVKQLDVEEKPLFLIHANIDRLMRSENRNQPVNEDAKLSAIRQDILKHLPGMEKKIFFISHVDPGKWDLEDLKYEILSEMRRPPPSPQKLESKTEVRKKTPHVDPAEKETLFDNHSKTMLDLLKKKMEDVRHRIRWKKTTKIQIEMGRKLEEWKKKELNVAVIGSSGVGKSSFINAMRGLKDGDNDAAPTGVSATTSGPTRYPYPNNPKVALWDLPGVGTTDLPDLKTYCKVIDFNKYQMFVIITVTRFSRNEVELAKKLFMKKPFFLVRAKIDNDYNNEKRKTTTKESLEATSKESLEATSKEEDMLTKIRKYCLKELEEAHVYVSNVFDEKSIFLISNKHPLDWDFPDLTQKMLTAQFSLGENVVLCFSMSAWSKVILQRKVVCLQDRLWIVALLSVVKELDPETKSGEIDYNIIRERVEFYMSQLGIPKENSEEFQALPPELQEAVQTFYLTSDLESWLEMFDSDNCREDRTRRAPFLDEVTERLFTFVYCTLYRALEEMRAVSLAIFDERHETGSPGTERG